MIPTSYIRYKTVYGECDKNSVSLVVSKYKVLQVWWAYDIESIHLEPLIHCGEWRDVPTVEEA